LNTKKVAYLQYTNPGGYPPLDHSSQLLARQGWDVLFLGVQMAGTEEFTISAHERITVRMLPAAGPGWKQKLHYVWYCLWSLVTVLRWQPDWIYASDLMTCPLAWLCAKLGFRVIYHEHDSPTEEALRQGFNRQLAQARVAASRTVRLCILPNEGRLQLFRRQLQPVETWLVWNCPRRDEVRMNRGSSGGSSGQVIRMLYHGSINEQRVPLSLLDGLQALPETIVLRIVGYETIGSIGYVDRIRARAAELKIAAHRLEILGAEPRSALMDICAESQIGIGFLPMQSNDVNMTAMFGASNKVFDYMACGLALIVSKQPDWAGPLVASGTSVACDPNDGASIAQAVREVLGDGDGWKQRGEAGRQRVLNDWNYDAQFKPVLELMEAAIRR
jgi:glycosyltransferase involved in cell wall biosynthesis